KHSGEELLAQLRGADIPDPPPPPPGRPRPDPAKAALVKKLAAIIQAAARELNLVPEVLATRRDLELLADGSRDVGLLRGWRRGAAPGASLTARRVPRAAPARRAPARAAATLPPRRPWHRSRAGAPARDRNRSTAGFSPRTPAVARRPSPRCRPAAA